MAEEGSLPAELQLSALPDPGERYTLGELLGAGVSGEVFEATDAESGGKRVAIKVQRAGPDNEEDLRNEYLVLKDLSGHPNLPDLYGVYLKKATDNDGDKLWFVMELCKGGPVTDLVRGLQDKNRRMSEEHIAYILKEVVKVLVYLHENRIMHRDVKGSNILLTKEGEVKLVDFGLSRKLKNAQDKRGTYVGSPCWMAPEVVASGYKDEDKVYDSRIDVWALGITAIELGDGKAPFQDINPTRALFQIVRNPPPSLYRPANWTQVFNDFIAECLEKNPEHRPYIMELLEHPFITGLPENDFHLSTELKMLIDDFAAKGRPSRRPEAAVRNGLLKRAGAAEAALRQEDLAAMERLSEDGILQELQAQLGEGQCHTFVGDVLLALNANEPQDPAQYGDEVHARYRCKARSDNAPHIYSVADKAYQDALHHEEPQFVILAGEALSGKTTNMMHLLRHLLYLGQGPNKIGDNIAGATGVIHALGNAATPTNPNSTRHVLQLELAFTPTGKLSGAIFWLYQLEKWRVTDHRRSQANFHVFYYLYDGLEASGRLDQYCLEGERRYRYLRTQRTEGSTDNPVGVREDPQGNVEKFREFEQSLRDIGFQDDQLNTLYNLLAAILVLGEVRFRQGDDEAAEVDNMDVAAKAAKLLSVDERKFSWALINYCAVQQGTAVRRRHSRREAEEARDVLACALYSRLVDWVVNVINYKLSFTRAVFGDKYSITLMDLFGFECFKNNGLEQLFVNTLNEQLQYHYNQRIFAWEMQEQEEEEIPVQSLEYFDNKMTVDELMAKPDGFLYLLDEGSRTGQGSEFILKSLKASRLQAVEDRELSVAHYTGRVLYDTGAMAAKNRDFLPPEMVDALRLSADGLVRTLFGNQLTRTGNLAMSAADCGLVVSNQRSRWGAALSGDGDRAKKWARETQGRFSQTRQLRTAAATFRGTSLDILRGLAVGPGSGGSHFVRCLRCDLTGAPRGFQPEVVRQQLRALAVLDTALARQKGYPHRVPFPEFLRRYKFLAFDFDENVDITKDNSRLLLVRLKMEGWVLGKSKVFLKYYNEEYLARTYEIQVKKIIKVQTMMRAFLAKRNVASKLLKFRRQSVDNGKKEDGKSDLSEEAAIVIIQKQYRGYRVRKELGPMARRKLDVNTVEFIREYCRRWKAKTIFQVLLMYRAARQQDLVYFSQQVHLYNQALMSGLDNSNKERMSLDAVECGARASLVLGKKRPAVWKLPFRLDQDLPYFDTTYLNDPMTSGLGPSLFDEDDSEPWDAPLRRGSFTPWKVDKQFTKDKEVQTGFSPTPYDNEQEEHYIQTPFCRDPTEMQSGKLLSQHKQKKPNDKKIDQKEHNAPSSVQSHVLHKRTEVYNPGKARRLEQRCEMDNRAQEWENNNNNNIPRNSGPKYNQRNVASPTTKEKQISSNYYNNRNSRDFDNNMRYPRENNWESPIPTNNKSSNYFKNQYNQQDRTASPKLMKKAGRGQLSNNPIAEMELRGKRSAADDDNDAPPFNFQAMLRKTNTNRASLRRNHDRAPIAEECNSETSSRSKHTSSVSSNNRPEPKESWIENQNRDQARSKLPWNEPEQWSKYETPQWEKPSSTKSWNDSENSSDSKKSWYENDRQRSDSMKSDSVKSWNKSEHEDNINLKKSQNEHEFNRSSNSESQNAKENDRYDLYKMDFMRSRDGYEKNDQYGSEKSLSGSSVSRTNSKKSLNGNETQRNFGSRYSDYYVGSEGGSNSNSKMSLNEDEQHNVTQKEDTWLNETLTTMTELVPGLIIQGQVADL